MLETLLSADTALVGRDGAPGSWVSTGPTHKARDDIIKLMARHAASGAPMRSSPSHALVAEEAGAPSR